MMTPSTKRKGKEKKYTDRKAIAEFRSVDFSYDRREFLKDINLKIYKDDFLGIVGPNGGGKTTLLRLLMGLETPDKGEVRLFSKSPNKGRRYVGYLSQFKDIDFGFPITVYDVVRQSKQKSIFKRITDKDEKEVISAMKKMDVFKYKDTKLSEMSGGEKQRVFVARAIADKPKLLVLDEPMTNLDMHIQEKFYDILKRLNKEMAVVIVDHDLEMLKKHTKEIACINKCNSHTIRYHNTEKMTIKELCDV